MRKTVVSFAVWFLLTAAVMVFAAALIIVDKNGSSVLGETKKVFTVSADEDGVTLSIMGEAFKLPRALTDGISSVYGWAGRFYAGLLPVWAVLLITYLAQKAGSLF